MYSKVPLARRGNTHTGPNGRMWYKAQSSTMVRPPFVPNSFVTIDRLFHFETRNNNKTIQNDSGKLSPSLSPSQQKPNKPPNFGKRPQLPWQLRSKWQLHRSASEKKTKKQKRGPDGSDRPAVLSARMRSKRLSKGSGSPESWRWRGFFCGCSFCCVSPVCGCGSNKWSPRWHLGKGNLNFEPLFFFRSLFFVGGVVLKGTKGRTHLGFLGVGGGGVVA